LLLRAVIYQKFWDCKTMTNQLTAYGLGLLWVGAMALGWVIMIGQKPLPPLPSLPPVSSRKKAQMAKDGAGKVEGDDQPSPEQAQVLAQISALQRLHQQRRMITLICQFTGSGGIIAGLGLLALGVMK
jgi:hypothetical protein